MKIYIRNPLNYRSDITTPRTLHQHIVSTTDTHPNIKFTTITIKRGKIGMCFDRWKYEDYYSRKVTKK